MNIYFKLYLLTRLDSIHSLLIVITTLMGLGVIISCGIWLSSWVDGSDDTDSINKFKKYIRKFGWALGICVVLLTMMPNKKEAIFIIAGGKTISFIQNDSIISKLPAKTGQIIDAYLSNELTKLKSVEKPKDEKNKKDGQ